MPRPAPVTIATRPSSVIPYLQVSRTVLARALAGDVEGDDTGTLPVRVGVVAQRVVHFS
jgi:hypothetical protein